MGQALISRLYASDALVRDAFRLCHALRYSVYHCIYLALARRGNSRVVTADAEFFGATKRLFGEFGLPLEH